MGDSLRPHLKLQNLYVREISREASPAVARAYLEKLGGPACHVKLPLDHNNNDKHIGIAYLNFNTNEESKKCLEKYRFSIRFKNQPAKLMYAPHDRDRVFGPYSFKFQIIIKNLSEEVDVQMLYSFFSTYGEIFQCKTDTDDHQQYYGQVTYIELNSVAMAVAGADKTRWQSSVIEVVPHHKAHMAEEFDRPRASISNAGSSEQTASFASSSGASRSNAHAAQRGVPTSASSSSSGQPQQPIPPPPPPSVSVQQRHQEQQQHTDELSDHVTSTPTPVNFALEAVYGTSNVSLPPPFVQPTVVTPVPVVPDSNALSPLDIPVAVPVAVPDGSRSAGLIGSGALSAAVGPTDSSSTAGPNSLQAAVSSHHVHLDVLDLGGSSGSVTPSATTAPGGAAAAGDSSLPPTRPGGSYLLDMLQRRRVDASSSSRPDTPGSTPSVSPSVVAPNLSHVGVGLHPNAHAASLVVNGSAVGPPAVGTGQSIAGRGHPMVSVCSGATVIITPGGGLSGHANRPKVGVLRGVLSSIEFISETLCCPITHELFVEPVVAADGITYERVAIEHWLSNHDTSPMTNETLSSPVLHPNNLVKALVDELL